MSLKDISKPVVFFSHSSRDSKALIKLKELILDKVDNKIDIFLTCDGQSIRFGTNWVSEIENALDRASIFFVFLTESSIMSKWVHFEAGYGYRRNVNVIPVGFLGVEISSLSPPLGLLQGFTIESNKTCDNILSILEKELKIKHTDKFSEAEYSAIISTGMSHAVSSLGSMGLILHNIEIYLNVDQLIIPGIEYRQNVYLDLEVYLCKHDNVPFIKDNAILLNGLSINAKPSPKKVAFTLEIEPDMFYIYSSTLPQIVSFLTTRDFYGTSITFLLQEDIRIISDIHRVSGKLNDAGITIVDFGAYLYKDLIFSMENARYSRIDIVLNRDNIDVSTIRELFGMLLDSNIINY